MRPTSFNRRALIAVLALALTACSGGSGDEREEVLATVNGEPVTRAMLQAFYRISDEEPTHEIQRRQALNQLVNAVLLAQEARARGLDERPEVASELAVRRKSALAHLLVAETLQQETIDRDDARGAYERRIAERAGGAEVRLKRLRVADEDTAQAAIEALNQGADFADAAPGGDAEGGNVGTGGPDPGAWLPVAELAPAVAEAVEPLAPGEHVAEPIAVERGWQVIELVGRRGSPPPAYETVKADVLRELTRERVRDVVDRLREAATVKWHRSPPPAAE